MGDAGSPSSDVGDKYTFRFDPNYWIKFRKRYVCVCVCVCFCACVRGSDKISTPDIVLCLLKSFVSFSLSLSLFSIGVVPATWA